VTSADSSALISQLDLISTLIRSIEETAFFVKLGQLTNLSRLYEDLLEILQRQGPKPVDTMIK